MSIATIPFHMLGLRRVSLIATRQTIYLKTSFDYPPIPIRNFDWSAYHPDTYDADWDSEREEYVSKCPVGTGATEIEAINDLFEKILGAS